ncbi:hypothetical protein BEWA_050730 [Theileria equi strain WA]|uniref:Uncharacterized protein n=1 Tax=Theileria equi strain WA TaxID=1537102 RepID=L1LBF3_THEEQ|nr:hypothetical protein BEWA_050730 [Theileria equi strain WA]EKX72605.1 hypothetical protein BEWA_050730 [Theileria equi strain WA]|eukprot:XP_004832057.1 hypothetical protein BEWA_050730 [Theileria equi strain WA]
MSKTCDPGLFWTYVDVDTDKISGSHYMDACNTRVTLTKNDNTPNNEYKEYLHQVPQGGYYLGGIYHNNKLLLGFQKLNYYKDVKVYYLRYDTNNLAPVLIGITKDETKYDYYKYNSIKPSEKWEREYSIESSGNNLGQKLNEITSTYAKIVILNLNKTQNNDKYEVDGNDIPTNSYACMSVTSTVIHGVYKKCTHSYEHLKIRVISTKYRGEYIPFDESPADTMCRCVNVYYWIHDHGHASPFILEFESESKPVYYKLDGVYDGRKVSGKVKQWKLDNRVTTENLKEELDTLNCDINRAHRIDISVNKDQAVTFCTSCSAKTTAVYLRSENVKNIYRASTHTLEDTHEHIGQLTYKSEILEGIDYVTGANTVTIIRHPVSNSDPSLLNYAGKWYRKGQDNKNRWDVIVGADNVNVDDADGIITLLENKVPVPGLPPQPTPPSHKDSSGTRDSTSDDSHINIHETKQKVREHESGKSGPPIVGIVVGAVIGLALACFVVHEGFMLRRNPEKSFIVRLRNRFNQFSYLVLQRE